MADDKNNFGGGLAVGTAATAHEGLMGIASRLSPADREAVEFGGSIVSKSLIGVGVAIGFAEEGPYGAVKNGIAGYAGYETGIAVAGLFSLSGVGVVVAPAAGLLADYAVEKTIDAVTTAVTDTPPDPISYADAFANTTSADIAEAGGNVANAVEDNMNGENASAKLAAKNLQANTVAPPDPAPGPNAGDLVDPTLSPPSPVAEATQEQMDAALGDTPDPAATAPAPSPDDQAALAGVGPATADAMATATPATADTSVSDMSAPADTGIGTDPSAVAGDAGVTDTSGDTADASGGGYSAAGADYGGDTSTADASGNTSSDGSDESDGGDGGGDGVFDRKQSGRIFGHRRRDESDAPARRRGDGREPERRRSRLHPSVSRGRGVGGRLGASLRCSVAASE